MKLKNLFKLARIALLLLLLVMVMVAPAAAQGPEDGDVSVQDAEFDDLLWNPADMDVPLNGAVAINRVNISGAEQVFGVTLNIGYDADKFSVNLGNIQPGNLLPGTRNVDYIMTPPVPIAGGPACVPGGAAVPAGFTVSIVYITDAGPIEGSGSLIEIPWQAHSGPAVDVCIDSTSEVVDQLGEGNDLGADVFTTLNVVGVAEKFQIGLQGGKNSGLTAADIPAVNVANATVNTFPCIGGIDADGYCAAGGLAPYDIEISRPGYLDVSVSFASLGDVTSLFLLAGDLNDDDQINIIDLQLMASLLGNTYALGDNTVDPLWEKADFTGAGYAPDGAITIADLVLVARNFGKNGPTQGEFPF